MNVCSCVHKTFHLLEIESCPCCPQALLQLPTEAPGSNLDHRQGAGECGFFQILEEDPCGSLQVALLTDSHILTVTSHVL